MRDTVPTERHWLAVMDRNVLKLKQSLVSVSVTETEVCFGFVSYVSYVLIQFTPIPILTEKQCMSNVVNWINWLII